MESESKNKDEKLSSPIKRLRFVERLARRPLDLEHLPDDVVLTHGTSVQVLIHVIKTGTLPGYTGYDKYPSKGDIFVAADADRIPNKRDPSKYLQTAEPAEPRLAEPYAELCAFDDYIMGALNIPLDDAKSRSLIGCMAFSDFSEESYESEIVELLKLPNVRDISHLLELRKDAKSRHGVLLGIKRSAITNNPKLAGFGFGDDGEGDFKLITGEEGLDIKYIGGIRFQSEMDKKDFENSIKRLNL